MNVLRTVMTEFFGLFIDDGSLALFVIFLVAGITGVVKIAGVSPLFGGGALLLGCVLLLAESLYRAARKSR